jgi:hypothetical protein
MSVKPWAVFNTDLPDDQVDDGREIITFGGRNVAMAIREILTRLGCEVGALLCSDEKGWEFGAKFKGRGIWCLVSSFHPRFFLNFDDPPAFGRHQDAPAYEEIAQKLNDAIMADPRFRDLQWYSREEGPPDPFDGPMPPSLPSGASKKELFARGLSLEIAAKQHPPTRWRQLAHVAIAMGFWLGLCSLWTGVTLLTRGDARGVILLPIGVFICALAALGVVIILGGFRRTPG